uniref:Uncharacterized protein n=1 Tax=Alexandrium catenella TaxID=2925 RepID=A0A7S1RV04_ALECA|mmetsp:Transcript_74518/g.197933  ORF Transcript_74518/g.197933 Transcript_74518/m.197933 type:complete len:203 (+) Transcript_74518:348-956(+)
MLLACNSSPAFLSGCQRKHCSKKKALRSESGADLRRLSSWASCSSVQQEAASPALCLEGLLLEGGQEALSESTLSQALAVDGLLLEAGQDVPSENMLSQALAEVEAVERELGCDGAASFLDAARPSRDIVGGQEDVADGTDSLCTRTGGAEPAPGQGCASIVGGECHAPPPVVAVARSWAASLSCPSAWPSGSSALWLDMDG